MKKLFIILAVASCFLSCKNKKENAAQETAVAKEETIAPAAADPAKDSAAIRKTIVDFYSWYEKNYRKLMEYNLYESIKNKNAAPYKINWDEVTRYQEYIRTSIPQLGEEFLKNQKILFTKADSAFKKDLNEDVPYYFDYDWYTNSQEGPEYLLDGINKSKKWIINVKGDAASVEIGAPDDKDYLAGSLLLYVGLKKENGQWTIAKIGND